jgi:transposase
MAAFRAVEMSTQEMTASPSIRQVDGPARSTVRKYLLSGQAQYGPRQPRSCKLDPYKSYLLECFEQARPQWISGEVLMREIRARPASRCSIRCRCIRRCWRMLHGPLQQQRIAALRKELRLTAANT